MKLNNIKIIGDQSNTTIYLAKQIVDIFSEIYPFIVDREITIIQVPDYEYPFCPSDKSYILIAASSEYWCQISYQLSHELLHFVIPDNYSLTSKNQWFEEVLAEMMSFYIMQIIGNNWSDNELSQLNLKYESSFLSYLDDTEKDMEVFNLGSLNNPDSELLKEFQSNPYKREHLRYLALKMLPIFKKHPILWQSILHLHRISDGLTLSGILDELAQKFPPATAALKELNQAILAKN